MAQSTNKTRMTAGIRTGGRSERVVREIMEATLDELGRIGYAGLSIDHVAARAGVAKTTVWRRWPTKADLVGAAIIRAKGDTELPDTGSLRGDLVKMAEETLALLKTPSGKAVLRLMTNEGGDPEVDRLARRLRDESIANRAKVVERARDLGQLPADVDVRTLLDVVFAPIMGRALRWNEWPSREHILRVVDLAVTGAEHGGGSAARVRSARTGRRGDEASAGRPPYRGGSGGSRR